MTLGIALLISNLWFISATESKFWKLFFGCFWLLAAILGGR